MKKEEKPSLLAQSARLIDDLEISVRSWGRAQEHGVVYVGDLIQLTPDQLLSWSGFGAKSLADVKDRLAKWGLSLGTSFDSELKQAFEDAKRADQEKRERAAEERKRLLGE